MQQPGQDPDQKEAIFNILAQIFQNIGVEAEITDFVELTDPDIYIEMFTIMFAFLEEQCLEIAHLPPSYKEEKMQRLIDLLAEYIQMDLSHIKGNKIVVGDQKHVFNLLQLLFELSRLLTDQGDQDDIEQPREIEPGQEAESQDQQNQNFPNERRNSLPDNPTRWQQPKPAHDPTRFQLPIELQPEPDQLLDKINLDADNVNEEDLPDEQRDQLFSDDLAITPNDLLEYPVDQLMQHPPKEQDQDYVPNQQFEEIQNNIEEMQKVIEENALPQLAEQKNLVVDNIQLQKEQQEEVQQEQQEFQQISKQSKGEKVEKDDGYMEIEPKMMEPKYQEENVESQQEMLTEEQQPSQELDQEPEDYGNDPLNDEVLYKLLIDNIMKVKENLGNRREFPFPDDDKLTREKFMRSKNQYKLFLKDYLKHVEQTAKRKKSQKNNFAKDLKRKLKLVKIQEKRLKQDLQNQKTSYALKQKDEKINYLRKMQDSYDLEKNKMIEEKKEYKEQRVKRNKQTRDMLDSIENAYKGKISMLKEKLRRERIEQRNARIAQKKLIVELEKTLKNEQMKQIQELRNMWQCEKEKFNLIMKDDNLLETKIMKLYKKYYKY